jgi:hypothetical protein
MALVDRVAKYISPRDPMVVIPGTIQDVPKTKPFDESGVTGLLRTKGVGYVYDEFLVPLSVHRSKQVYREMWDNDAVINSLRFALEMILRRAEWSLEAAPGKKGNEYADFIDGCREDMSHTWEDFVAECVSMFAFGFSLFEEVYKRRKGPDGRKASRYNDGLIGWRKFAPRAQESILYWIWDDEGGLQGAVQLAAPDYRTVPLPIEKLLLFRTTSLKNNPEGRSVLRGIFRTWLFKRRIEEVEGVGIERDLCGIPVLYATSEAVLEMGGMDVAKKLVRDIRVDDQMGVVLPRAFDEKGNSLVELVLLKAAGRKMTDPGATIQRYNSDMLNTVLAGFVQFGQTPTGSRALHMSATQIFSLAITAFMDSIAAVINRIAIPRLMTLNRMDLEQSPKLKPGDIGPRDLDELSNYVQKLSMGGLTFFDKPTADYLRTAARLPETPEGDEAGPLVSPMAQATANALPPEPKTPPDQEETQQISNGNGKQPPGKKPPVAAKPSGNEPSDKEAEERLARA